MQLDGYHKLHFSGLGALPQKWVVRAASEQGIYKVVQNSKKGFLIVSQMVYGKMAECCFYSPSYKFQLFVVFYRLKNYFAKWFYVSIKSVSERQATVVS